MLDQLTIPDADAQQIDTAAEQGRRLKFGPDNEFQQELRRRVDEFFRTTGRRQRDCWQMYLKTALLFATFAATYALLVFVAETWWQAWPLTILLGLVIAGIGFNVQHDGGHHAYSDRRWVNKLMSMSLDLLGGSSYIWSQKHNFVHHTYANISGHDDDINIGFFGRLSPHQPRLLIHRWQHIYLWALYGFLPLKWQLFDDFRDLILGKIGDIKIPRPKGWDLVIFFAGKSLFFSLAIGIPLLFHPLWVVLLFYVAASFVQGVVLSVVFQLAHCVQEAAFPLPEKTTGRIETAWAVHQVETTVDFGRQNRLLTWFVGGLNFQIEHHLFPRICHVNYPALSKVVEETCREFGVKYTASPTLRAGLASHYLWLREMGKAEIPADNDQAA